MIKYLTGGDVCYGQPVNHVGLVIALIAGLILIELIRIFKRKINE